MLDLSHVCWLVVSQLGGTGNVLYPSRSYGFTRTMFLGGSTTRD